MGFIKKIMYGSVAIIFILMGGFGTQSNSMILQLGGIVGLIFGAVILYIFAKMAWRAMGCIPSLLVLILIIVFVLFAIGGFNGGISSVGQNVQTFLGQQTNSSSENIVNTSIEQGEENIVAPNDNKKHSIYNKENWELTILRDTLYFDKEGTRFQFYYPGHYGTFECAYTYTLTDEALEE